MRQFLRAVARSIGALQRDHVARLLISLDRLVPSNDYPVDPAWLDAVPAAMRIGARSHQWEAKAPG